MGIVRHGFLKEAPKPGDFALCVVGPIGATVGAGSELQETFRNRSLRDRSDHPEMRTRRPLVEMIWSMKLHPYQIHFWLGKC